MIKVETQVALKRLHRELSRKALERIISETEAKSSRPEGTSHEEDVNNLLDSSRRTQKIDQDQEAIYFMERMALGGAYRQTTDSRFREIRQKLRGEEEQKQLYLQYVHSIKRQNSRQNVVPGRLEAKEESLCQQLLIGKLRNNGHLPLNAPSSKRIPQDASSQLLESRRRNNNQPDLASEGSVVQEPSSALTRAIPQILSDQVSNTDHESSIPEHERRLADPKVLQSKKPALQHYIFEKEPTNYGFAHLKQSKDYKPHDAKGLEQLPELQKYGFDRISAKKDPRDKYHASVISPAAWMEPEPETPQKRNYQQSLTPTKVDPHQSQQYLDQLIYSIQNDNNLPDGYFIYLRRNADNPGNPYDLVPFLFGSGDEKQKKAENKADANESQAGRAPAISSRAQNKLGMVPEFQSKRQEGRSLSKTGREGSSTQHRHEVKHLGDRQSYKGTDPAGKDDRTTQQSGPDYENNYFTLSKKGLTAFQDQEPREFVKIEHWLVERDQFLQISQKTFFKRFRTWKILRMWKRNIVQERRETVTGNLKARLFAADATFGPVLLEHRQTCQDLERLRVIDFQQSSREAFLRDSFQRCQEETRLYVQEEIRNASNRSRELFKAAIESVLESLRQKISMQEATETDDNTFGFNNIHSSKPRQGDYRLLQKIEKLEDNQVSTQDPIYERIGFKKNLRFSARSELRDSCKKFLRFAFLLDFIALESLSNIFLLSITDCMSKLKLQIRRPVNFDLGLTQQRQSAEATSKPAAQKSLRRSESAKQRASAASTPEEVPLFASECIFREMAIPSSCYKRELIDRFEQPPLGRSTKKDFHPIAHLELEAEQAADPEQGPDDARYYRAPDETFDTADKVEVTRVFGLQKVWLQVLPDAQDLSGLLNKALQLGFDSLKNFERWSMHADLEPYDKILEPWDYRAYEKWAPPSEEDERYLNCEYWLVDNPEYQHREDNIDFLIAEAMVIVEKQFEKFEPMLEQYWINQQIQINGFRLVEHERLKNPVEMLPILLQRFVDQKTDFDELILAEKDLGLLRMNFGALKSVMTPQPKECLLKLKEILPRLVRQRISASREWVKTQIDSLRPAPSTVDEFVTQLLCLECIEDTYQEVKDQVELNDQIFQICEQFDLPSREDRQSKFIGEIYQLINTLNQAIIETKEKADKHRDGVKKKILGKIPKLNSVVEQVNQKILEDKFLRIENADCDKLVAELQEYEQEFAGILDKKKKIQIYQKTMDMGHIEPFTNVEETKILLNHRAKLWNSIKVWTENVRIWQTSRFEDVDIDRIREESAFHAKIVLQCERNLPPGSSAVAFLKKLVFDFKETVPIVEALGNKNLDEVHWAEIKEILNIRNFPLEEKQFSLGQLVDFDVAHKADDIVNVSITATQENNLRVQLDRLKEIWAKLEFDLDKHKDKDAFKLVKIEKVQAVLDDSMQISSQIVGSRYVQRLQPQAQEQQDRLHLIYETLEQWRECQRNWLYLENIFSSTDIRRQRSKDCQEYENINKSWNKLMRQVVRHRNIKLQCSTSRQRLNDFIRWNAVMDKIQKNLEDYLEEKRELFPRFYFISNDELLQILASQQDLKSIEKQVKKCFENLQSFLLSDELAKYQQQEQEEKKWLEQLKLSIKQKTPGQAEVNNEQDKNDAGIEGTEAVEQQQEEAPLEVLDHSDLNDIYGIKSIENEGIRFTRVLKIRGQGVEVWMKTLEELMITVVQRRIKEAFSKYYEESHENDRKVWVLSFTSQAVAVVDLITWTEGTEIALSDAADGNPCAMEDHFNIMREQLARLAELVRSNLTVIQRRTLVALVTQDVHARDIVEQLWTTNIESINDFLWQQQLRYYMEDEQVIIRQVNAQMQYAYEYMGPTTRLVITPLTDKCWMTITGAMHIKLGAAPTGPAGTGKTESTKDLAKALGIFCVVINCSDQIEYKNMAKLFSGVVQSGSWTCLDEFNRINIEVLSVIAQQLLDIKQAKVMGREQFLFNEKERAFKHSCGVFITMNPGYAGRTELPDNLKVLFRQVSMMIPNYRIIAEIMLFAEGFSQAKALSTKMVQLYKLASEQLSQQDHYDFGMRAVKSVLVMAGNLKRVNTDMPESVVLIRAMRDSNVPKFLSADLPLFSALIQDLFPGVEIPETKQKELESEIKNSMRRMRLQSVESLNYKVEQLFETLNVRFGVMIVGPAGGGKTTAYQVLSDAMTKLRVERKSSDPRYQVVKYKVLNPKSISMGELYGEVNPDSQEWTDGLASGILRKFAQIADSERKNWCVFDGPVDALWIENMNTVLDDNMTLCLVNGERIKLGQNIRILFEVQDLAQASPATVSRCGMVYVTPSDLGWRPYFYSWSQSFVSQILDREKQQFLINLFEMFVDLAFERLKRLRHFEIMPTTEIQNVQCFCIFLQNFLTDKKLSLEEKKEYWQKQINLVFAFSMIWGFGSSYDRQAHRYLDNMFRDFFAKLNLPQKDTVFQFYYNVQTMRFSPWEEIVPEFEARIVAPYDQLFVPTVDSASYTKILSYLMEQNNKERNELDDKKNNELTAMRYLGRGVFFTGGTGVGKSLIIQEFIRQNQEQKSYSPIVLNFSAQTSSQSVQKSIESKLEKKRGKKVIGAKGNQLCLIFIDDINMPLVEQYGAQPPIEFLRLLLDAGIIYDRPAFFKKSIDRYQMICAAAPPGGGRAALTSRFMRHFHIINIPNASEEILTIIFDKIIGDFLQQNFFSDDVRKCGNIAVASTIDMFTQFNKKMLPIPSRFHYLFNLRDVSKVFQGILMTRPESVPNSKVFTRLWLHECQRVFCDRLVDEKDRQFFKSLALELVHLKFKEKWSEEELFCTNYKENKLKVTFSMILKCDFDEKLYEEVTEPSRLIKALEDKMVDYNYTFTQAPMNIIFFEDAVDHICRIARVLKQPRGNAMLIGVSGCGKQSLTKLAAFLHDAPCSQIKLVSNYKPQNFRDDIKLKLLDSGCNRQSTVFVVADTQILHEQFLEDINSILNIGEIADLYKKEDYDRMEASLQKFMKELRIPPSKENIYTTFIKELRLNFHVVLCMSPLGDQLRIRCRNFPSLVNCCSLDWYDDWPLEALGTVAQQYFATNQVMNDSQQKQTIINIFPLVHSSVQDLANKYYAELKRRVYITPKTFLNALSLFKDKSKDKQIDLSGRISRLRNGIEKLEATNLQIKELQITLTELIPKLLEQNESAKLQILEIEEQTSIASKREQEVENEARIVQSEARSIGKLKEEADFKLEKAKPALLAADKAVSELSKDDITELKKVNNPIPAVQLALECTLTYLGSNKLDWATAQKALADMKFLEKLRSYDRDNIPDSILNKIRVLTRKPEFNIEKMTKASKAAGGLSRWCKALHEYAEALLVVRPLLEKQTQMIEKQKSAQAAVQMKESEVQAIKFKIEKLLNEYDQTLALIESLSSLKNLCERRLHNASQLLGLLTNEGQRWKKDIVAFESSISKFYGDIFVSASIISYLGPFTGQYREKIISLWTEITQRNGVELSPTFSLVSTLGDPIEIRKWGISGLPSDSVSIDNGILTTKSDRWPMLIDPQFQGNTWLKKMFRDNKRQNFNVIQLRQDSQVNQGRSSGRNQHILEHSIKNGSILLLEDMPEEIDPSIESIISKSFYNEEGVLKISLGGKSIDYDQRFKLFMTSKLANPHFLPEVTIKLSIINFTVTFDGLEEQLLAEAVKNLDPEVERTRDLLVIQISSSKAEQFEIQSSILTQLADSNQDTILDNDKLIENLKISNEKGLEISQSLKDSEKIEKTVELKREKYRDISTRGSILYFVIASLQSIDSMYQNSLVYVRKIFNESIQRVIKPIQVGLNEENLEEVGQQPIKKIEVDQELIQELVDNITMNLYINVCRGLFEQHKIIFSFMLASSIQKNIGSLDETLFDLLLRGPGVYDKSMQQNYSDHPDIYDFMKQDQWDFANCIQLKVQGLFQNLVKDIIGSKQMWREFSQNDFDSNQCILNQFPLNYNKLPSFHKIILIKLFKPQKLIDACVKYVELNLGRVYAVSPMTSMEDLFNSSDKLTPVIFILSQGADPNERILQYAQKIGFQDKLFQKSLGQGQQQVAQNLIGQGIKNGEWILLQNCHLFKSWMPQLEQICSNMRETSEEIHDDFRLILTSMPVDYVPSSILQNGVKMTTEAPQGLKANLKRIFTNVIGKKTYCAADDAVKEAEIAKQNSTEGPDTATGHHSSEIEAQNISHSSTLNNKQKPQAQKPSHQIDFNRQFLLEKCWRTLLFGLSFFHSVIQERKKFGSLGWNIKYEFNDSDLETSIVMTKNFLFESETIPWDSMKFMTGHINYGGRVTDEHDLILLNSMLNKCFGEEILDSDVFIPQNMQKSRSQQTAYSRGRRSTIRTTDFCFFGMQKYKIPKSNQDLDEVKAFIDSLSDQDDPQLFGMHPNANIVFQAQLGDKMVKTLLNIQMPPVMSSRNVVLNGSKSAKASAQSPAVQQVEEEESARVDSSDKVAVETAQELYQSRPLPLSLEECSKEIFKLNQQRLLHCFSTVLLQEQERYNRLIKVIETSLDGLIKAIQGLVVMSPELDQMYGCLLRNQVPKNWEQVSYNSQKSLASWYKDLHNRIEFMRKWLAKGHPESFWLSGFFFPHGFMTGVLQTYARKHGKAIDFLKFKFRFVDGREPIRRAPDDGVYIYGLFVESAKWCHQSQRLVEQGPGETASLMPVIHFLPFEIRHKVVKQAFGGKPQQQQELTKPGNVPQGSLVQVQQSAGTAMRQRTTTGKLVAVSVKQTSRPLLNQSADDADKSETDGLSEDEAWGAADVRERSQGEEDETLIRKGKYFCPVYKTSARAGALSTTGQSTNFILTVALPIEDFRDEDHYILRGTALLTMLDD